MTDKKTDDDVQQKITDKEEIRKKFRASCNDPGDFTRLAIIDTLDESNIELRRLIAVLKQISTSLSGIERVLEDTNTFLERQNRRPIIVEKDQKFY